jgi:hypothetical protein
MALDCTLTPEQHELRLAARDFAGKVLSQVDPATRHLATPEERWAATKPIYEQVIVHPLRQEPCQPPGAAARSSPTASSMNAVSTGLSPPPAK